MKKYLSIVILTLSLGGCAQFQSFTDTVKADVQKVGAVIKQAVTPDNFDNVTLAYYSTLAVGNAYRDACERKIINKSCWNVIERLQPYDTKAYNSYLVLKDFVKSNPTLDASIYLKLAREAITALTSKQNENGVK